MNYYPTGLDKAHKFFKVLYFLIYLLATAFFVYSIYDSYKTSIANPDQFIDGFSLAFALIIAILAPLAYGVLLIIGLIQLIMSLANTSSDYRGKQIGASVFMMILPLLSELLLIGAGIYFNAIELSL